MLKQQNKRPIVYLLSIEDIVQSPLIRSQVLNLLAAIAAQNTERSILIVSLYPVLNWLRYHHQISQLRVELADKNLKLYLFPLFHLTRHFYIPRLLLPSYIIQAWLAALWISLKFKPAIVHCRSYPAAIVGKIIKKICDTKLVFDPRSLYPEEGTTREVSGKSVMFTEKTFEEWKRIEVSIVRQSDALVTVSQPFADIFASQYAVGREQLHVIPTTTSIISLDEVMQWHRKSRNALGFTEDQVVVGYVGTWFNSDYALKLFRLLIQLAPDVKWHFLLIVSRKASGESSEYADQLNQLMEHELGRSNICTVLSLPQEDVFKYLASADMAAQVGGVPARMQRLDIYNLMAKTFISIKFVEYLACGLPVLVSRWYGAAADIVQEQDLGQVYDETSMDDLRVWFARWLKHREDFSKRAWSYAYEHFSIQRVSNNYLELYTHLLDQTKRGD